MYGGNLGKPQDIPFIIECLRTCEDIEDAFFLIVGNGTEYRKLERYVSVEKPRNVKLMQRLPKEDYDRMIGSCDVGMIFLDHRFTIPNFPSRLLAYMQAKLPVLACTDKNSDIGQTIVDGGYGWWSESDNSKKVKTTVSDIIYTQNNTLAQMGECAYKYLKDHFCSEVSFNNILDSIGRMNE